MTPELARSRSRRSDRGEVRRPSLHRIAGGQHDWLPGSEVEGAWRSALGEASGLVKRKPGWHRFRVDALCQCQTLPGGFEPKKFQNGSAPFQRNLGHNPELLRTF